MQAAILVDVGQIDYHVGDEAMGHAAVAALQARGIVEPMLLSRDPEHTAARFDSVVPVRTLRFPWPPEDRARYLEEIRAVLGGRTDALPPEDQLFALIEDLRGADALLIAGGGNLNSRYGWLLSERAAAVEIARSLGLPVVISGQTLGPELSGRDRAVLARMLDSAVLVGLRDPSSLRLARELCPGHPGLRPCPDDSVGWALDVMAAPWNAPQAAPGLGDELDDELGDGPGAGHDDDERGEAATAQTQGAAAVPEPRRTVGSTALGEVAPSLRPAPADPDLDPTVPRIVATFAPSAGPFEAHEAAEVFAIVLDALVQRTGGVVELVPHLARPGEHDGDEEFHRRVAARMRSVPVHRPIEDAEHSLRRILTADYVVTSRYHPLVFGLAGGAAVLPIAVDRYAEVRMDGACRTWGISGQAVPLAALITPREAAWDTHQAAQRWTQEAVEGRRETSADLLARRAGVRETCAAWWDGVLVGLSGALPGPSEVPEVPASGAGTEYSRGLRRDWTDPVAVVAPGSAASTAIIMRTKDRPLLLERALDDVLAQTLADWRLVIVNDGGDPEPVQRLVDARAERFRGRCRILSHRRSVGMEAASNRGLRESDSEFVVIHDDDDTWDPQFLQRSIAFLERPSCADIGVMVRTEIVYEELADDGDGGAAAVRETGRGPFWTDQRSITLSDLLSINRGVPISFLYRRSLHGLVGDYDESLPAVGDWEFHLRTAQSATIGFIDGRPLAFWHQRPTVVGVDGNSMFAAQATHDQYDLRVRERHLREWTDQNGIGLPLWMAREIQDLRGRLDSMQSDQREILEQNREILAAMQRDRERLLEAEQRIKARSFVSRAGRMLRRIAPWAFRSR